MITEKSKKQRLVNIITYAVFALVSLLAYFLPLNGNNVLTMETDHSNLVSGPASVWYLFFITLVWLGLFIRFQAQTDSIRHDLATRTRDILGWQVPASFVLYALSIVLWHFELLTLSLIGFALLTLVLLIANGNIREAPQVMDEKFWVRIPFSLFLGWSLYLLMTTIAMRWNSFFSDEVPAVILLGVFLVLVLLITFFSRNIGVAVVWLVILIFKQIQYVESYMFRMAAWAGIAAMLIISIIVARKSRQDAFARKPVNRGMDKYNYGEESQIDKLEDELNEELNTKPGDKISLR